MSYTRRFTKTISVHYSGSVSYPPSQSGGSASYSGTTYEKVVFDVTVDTDPFDSEVESMKHRVDLLTGSVVATESAHVAVINESSRRVGDTIIAGFFKTVKSDISQQIAELKIRSESLLLQLNKLAGRCRDKMRQMSVDYQRISDRYGKIFTDLNQELENRVYSIDEPVFRVSRTLDEIGSLPEKDDTVATVSVSAGENAHVHSMIAANIAKRRAAEAIEKGHRFLQVQKQTDHIINRCLLSERKGELLSAPYCVMETVTEKGRSDREIHVSPLLDKISKEKLFHELDNIGWESKVNEEADRAITDYFNREAAEQRLQATDEHQGRVAELTMKLFNLSQTAAPGK